MSFDADTLYRLLPAIHRLRDQNAMGTLPNNPTPEALKQLAAIIADQVAVLEEELEQLYENQFAETAAPWALPYIGELLGLTGLDAAGQSARFAPRAEVANTIAYRRRKGTAAMLEQLAHDIMGRPAAAVEFWSRLATTQHVNHVRLKNLAWASVRQARQLEFIGSPFESATRTVEVRRIEPGLGKWNIPNVGLFGWRLREYSRTRSPLVSAHMDTRHFRMHPLGLDVPLCAQPETETDITHLAEPKNVPVVLTWRLFAGDLVGGTTNQFHPDATWYGPDRSVQLWRITAGEWEPIAAMEIVVCNLHDVYDTSLPPAIVRWGHNTALFGGQKKILLDPLRGRVVLAAAEEIFATFYSLFPGDVGGGEYARTASFDKSSAPDRTVRQQPPDTVPTSIPALHIADALNAGLASDTIIEIADSGIYVEELPDVTANGAAIELRAQDGRWPVLILNVKEWNLSGDDAGSITLNGLLITGQSIGAGGNLGTLRLRHCTLLPGLNIGADGRLDSTTPRSVALEVTAPGTKVELENCIIGPLRVSPGVSVQLRNCIVDAGADDAIAICGTDAEGSPGGTWRIENSTIRGKVAAKVLELASNSIFLAARAPGDDKKIWPAPVLVQQRQEGCVRFCSLPRRAIVPRQHQCVPREDKDATGRTVIVDATPQFISLLFGDAAYCQLRHSCPDAIRRGADDESEMGVYHDLLEPRREEHLRARLQDYLRFGLEAGIFYEQQTPQIRGID